MNKRPCRPYSHCKLEDEAYDSTDQAVCSGPTREEFKYCMEAPEEECVLSFHLEKKRKFSSKVDVKSYCSILKVS